MENNSATTTTIYQVLHESRTKFTLFIAKSPEPDTLEQVLFRHFFESMDVRHRLNTLSPSFCLIPSTPWQIFSFIANVTMEALSKKANRRHKVRET